MMRRSVKREFFGNVIPSMIAFAFTGVYAIVDGFFVGRNVGDAGLAAINVAYPLVALIQAAGTGLGMAGTGIVVSIVIGIVTVLTGSGVASFTGLVPIAPAVAAGLGGDAIDLAMMMQLASEFLRPVSPVAGVIIIVAGFANANPLAVVRRTLIPCFGGLIVSLFVTIFFML